ncbi:MAG: hypothetical protein ACM31C_17465 [Acidobacteriota bacterium]
MTWQVALCSLAVLGCGEVRYESRLASVLGYDPPRLACDGDATCAQVDRRLAQLATMRDCDIGCMECDAAERSQGGAPGTELERLVTAMNDRADGCQAWRLHRLAQVIAVGSPAVPTLARELSIEIRVHALAAAAALIALGRRDVVDRFCASATDHVYRDEVCLRR